MGGAVLMFAITDRKRSREFAAWFQGQQIPLVLATPGQGTATTEVLDWLGLEATEKVVLMLVAPQSQELVRRAERDLWLDVPGRGILMTVPLSSIGGARAKNYLLKQEGEVMEQERTRADCRHYQRRPDGPGDGRRAFRRGRRRHQYPRQGHRHGAGKEVLRRYPVGGKGDRLYPHRTGKAESYHESHHGPGRNADRRSVPCVLPACQRYRGSAAA